MISSFSTSQERPVIYQLLVRTFGNINETRELHGTIEENGCGKFRDINKAALTSLREMGFNTIWLTGVLEQVSGTEYPGRPADPVGILKGLAGSPYAIRDYFDVCPDYAVDPDKRIEEFKELVNRCHAHGFRVIIDFIPNHVARTYLSDVRPEHTFGEKDMPNRFFDRDNHFYYLREDADGGGPPLILPNGDIFKPEMRYGKVTGNNVISWQPSVNDWYETIKLNYGHDFTTGRDTSHLPDCDAAFDSVPKTWRTMDGILSYWQGLGVDGFRVDMAHMVPMEFWRWAVKRARQRQPHVFFSAEAYNDDPTKLTEENVQEELIKSGFDAVYDHPSYKATKGLYEDEKWANDLDALTFTGNRFHQSVRYAENHDEVRIANHKVWGGHGAKLGKPVSAVLYAFGRGPVMLYHGQEVGEPGNGPYGFAGDNSRTTIFDYWSMPEFAKWVNRWKYDGKRLSPAQRELRAWYGKLLKVIANPAFTNGEFYGLNYFNGENLHFGRLDDEGFSGHWLYAFLRHDRETGQSFLVLVNFHPSSAMRDVKVIIPEGAQEFLGRKDVALWFFADRLDSSWSGEVSREMLASEGVSLPQIAACSAMMMEIST